MQTHIQMYLYVNIHRYMYMYLYTTSCTLQPVGDVRVFMFESLFLWMTQSLNNPIYHSQSGKTHSSLPPSLSHPFLSHVSTHTQSSTLITRLASYIYIHVLTYKYIYIAGIHLQQKTSVSKRRLPGGF